jgi:hypothetical protein
MKISLTGLLCATGLAIAAGQVSLAEPAQRNNICISTQNIESMSYPDDKTILFRMRGGPVKVYRNDLPIACPGLKFESGIAWDVHDGTVCSHMQTFYVLRRGNPCMLGEFTPAEMRKPG